METTMYQTSLNEVVINKIAAKIEQDYTSETIMGLFQFQRNITDALKLIEHGTN